MLLHRSFLFIGVAIFTAIKSADAAEPLKNIGFSALGVIFGLFIVYVGFVGQGNNRFALRDDIVRHRENKRRYRWWF